MPLVNGRGKDADDKLEKIIEMMIASNIHGYCLQETWNLGSSTICIRDHTIFHHGIESRPNAQGQNSAGVMTIIGTDLTRAWERAGKL